MRAVLTQRANPLQAKVSASSISASLRRDHELKREFAMKQIDKSRWPPRELVANAHLPNVRCAPALRWTLRIAAAVDSDSAEVSASLLRSFFKLVEEEFVSQSVCASLAYCCG